MAHGLDHSHCHLPALTPHVTFLVAPFISTSASVAGVAKLRPQEVPEVMCSPRQSCVEKSSLQTVEVH